MVGDGKKVYHHEDDGKEHQIGGCHRNIVNTQGPVQTRVTYYKKTLEVQMKIDDEDWNSCFTVPNVELPKKGYIGFTAHTGALSARHDLLAVTAAKIDGPAASINMFGYQNETSPHHFKTVFFLLAIFGLAGYGFYVYKNNERRNHF